MLRGLKVMLVDDEVEIRRSLQGLLLQLGCEVRCAAGQAQAMVQLDEGFVPQVLLVDHRLRGERGTEVIAGLRARLGPVAAVLVTGDTEPALIQAAREAGHQVLHKPVQGPVLAGLLLDLQRRPAQPPVRQADGG
jgi:CheY-like chemotaxis protein